MINYKNIICAVGLVIFIFGNTLYAQDTHKDGTCLNDYHIEKHTTITTSIDAADSITSKAVVPNGHSVNYKAGRRIMLLPGFRTEPGSAFYASVGGCDTPEKRIQEEIIDKASIPLRNYPNPFTGQTTIEFKLSKDTPVTLYVSDVTGKQIAVLLNNDQKTEGIHTVTFDSANYPAGMYYYTIQASEYYGTQKMILAK